jgi:hypothetical protein
MNSDWPDFPGCEFEILGVDGSSVKFVSARVLDKRVLFTGVVVFNVTVTISTWEFSFNNGTFSIADYNGLRGFRDQIDAICKGKGDSASIGDYAATVRVRQHRFGVRERLLVEGEWASHHDVRAKSIPLRDAMANYVVVENQPAIAGRFAFVTACVDPPHLETAVKQMDEILAALEDAGFRP